MAMNEKLVAPYPMTIGTPNGLNVDNSLNERLGRTMQFVGGGGSVIYDLGSIRSVDTAAILATDAAVDSVFTVSAYSSKANADSSANALYRQDAIPVWASPDAARRLHRQGLHLLPEPVAARWWRIDGSPMNIGRVVIGKSFTGEDTMDLGFSYKVVDLGQQRRSSGGLDDDTLRGKVLEYAWTWSWMTEQEARNALIDVLAYAGNTRNLLCILNPDATDLHNVIGYGKLVDEVEITNIAGGEDIPNAYQASFRLQSRLILNL